MKMIRLTAVVLSAVLSVSLADEVILKSGACIGSNLLAQSPEVSNYHCEASPSDCAVGEEWWDPFKTAEDGLRCHFSSVARYDDLNEKHIESTRTIDSTTKTREDLTFPGIVNLSNAYANSLPSAELTKKSLMTQSAFPKVVQNNQHVTPSIQGDKTIPTRGACIDANQSAQSQVSNYHCETSPYYCDAGEEWWDLIKTAEEGLYCNHLMTSYNKLNKETHKLTRKRKLLTHTSATKLSDDRMLQVICNDDDYNVLMKFHESMSGINWTNDEDWGENRHCCTWKGVECAGDRVNKISLVKNNLSGLIPSEIGSLTELTELTLGNNKINGVIPHEVGNLAKLRILALNKNEISGELPTHLGKLGQLERMFLGINLLTGEVPCEIWGMANLEKLVLNNNNFTGAIVIQDADNCNESTRRLQQKPNAKYQTINEIYLNDNDLSGTIPTEFGKFTTLSILDLTNNRLTGSIPAELCALGDIVSSDSNVGQCPITYNTGVGIKEVSLGEGGIDSMSSQQMRRGNGLLFLVSFLMINICA